MRVLHCISSLVPDGAQRMLVRLLEGIDRTKIQTMVLSLTDEVELASAIERTGAEVRSVAMAKTIPSLRSIGRLKRIVKEFQPDIIQGWLPHGNIAALIAQRFARPRPYLLWNMRRSLYELKFDKRATRFIILLNAWLSRFPDRIIYCAEEAKRTHEQFGFASHRGIVIGNGFDPRRFAFPPSTRNEVRDELGVDAHHVVIGAIGRNHRQKDLPNFLRAASQALKRNPNCRFVLIGRGVGMSDQEIKQLVTVGNIHNATIFLGEREDVPRLLQGLDIFCSSSRSEGFPNVVAEAMLSGLPCVVTDVGASKELVTGIGKVVTREESEALANALCCFIESRDLRKEAGQQSRQRASEKYSLDAIRNQYLRLYGEVFQSQPRNS